MLGFLSQIPSRSIHFLISHLLNLTISEQARCNVCINVGHLETCLIRD